MAIDTPSSFRLLSVLNATSLCCIAVDSVISSSSSRAGRPLSLSTLATSCTSLGSLNWRGERFTETCRALRADERRPAAGFAQHPFADLQDEARLLRRLDEFRRADEAAMRVLPAHQGLVRHDLPALHRD